MVGRADSIWHVATLSVVCARAASALPGDPEPHPIPDLLSRHLHFCQGGRWGQGWRHCPETQASFEQRAKGKEVGSQRSEAIMCFGVFESKYTSQV